MASITSIAVQSPAYRLTMDEIPNFSRLWFPADTERQSLFQRLCAASGVENRHFALPYKESVQLRGLKERESLYKELGSELLEDCLRQLIAADSLLATRVQNSIFSSCSLPLLPALDTLVLPKLGLNPSALRIPLFQHGCIGGVIGLSLAAKLASTGESVLVSSVELCSLVFQPEDSTMGHLVGAAIFADGSGAMTVEQRPGLARIRASHSALIPATEHLIGYRLLDDGLHLVLDKELPRILGLHLPSLVRNFLKHEHLETSQISYWLVHPGGKKILDECVQMFDLEMAQARWSYRVLKHFGNISSAGIFFVLDEFFKSNVLADGETALVIGMGPGLTIELILLEGE